MLANVLAHWLTSAGERTYEGPFCQLLIAEGDRVLFAPVHHPHEHGKDLVVYAADGALCAYQLKGGDIGLPALEEIQPQLLALCGTAISYPGVEPPRRPDRVYLVSNGNLSAPARDRLAAFNMANRADGRPAIEVIEREQLLSRFGRLHDALLPTEPRDLRELLELTLADGRSEFDIVRHSRLFERLLREQIPTNAPARTRRAFASALLLTAYSVAPWSRNSNHLAVAQAWLALCLLILAEASDKELDEELWQPAFLIAQDIARGALRELVDEVSARDDLVIPDIVEGLVYPIRALLVVSFLSAFLIAEEDLAQNDRLRELIEPVILREIDSARATGECSAGQVYLACLALQEMGHADRAAQLAVHWMLDLCRLNQPDNKDAVPDPYHLAEEVLLSQFEEGQQDGERFDGQAYSLHVFIDWCARRDLRLILAPLWSHITHIHFNEFQPGTPARLLRYADESGRQLTWIPKAPQSWAELRAASRRLPEAALPRLLWRHRFVLPFLPLLLPHRLTSSIAKALDWLVFDACEIEYSDEAASES